MRLAKKSTFLGPTGSKMSTTNSEQFRASARSSSSVFGGLKHHESKASMTSFNQKLTEHRDELLDMEGGQFIKEHLSEENQSNHSSISCESNKGGMNSKQLKAREKLTLYQKGWQRINKMLNRGNGLKGQSLL